MNTTPKQHQIELKDLAAWQKAILDSSEYGIISTDIRGLIATFNRTSEVLLGYEAEEMIGKQTPEIIHDSDEVIEYAGILSKELGQPIEPGFEVFVAKGRLGIVDNREWTYICKDGSRFPVHLSVTAIRDADEEIVGFLGTFLDLRERKAFQANLRESESRYQALFDSANDGIVLGGVDAEIIECNPAASRIFGGAQQQIVGKTIDDFSPKYQADGKSSSDKAKAIITATLNGNPQFFEWQHTKLDGTAFDAEVSLNAVTIDNVPHWFGTIRDVTDRKKAEAERSLLINELERSNTEMERFTYTISHELKTPLVTISGFTGLLQRDAEAGDKDKLAGHVRRVTDAVGTMAELLDELLELSRIGRIVNKREKLELGELAYEVVETLGPHAAEKKLDIEIEPDMPVVYGDVYRLKLVLKNLIENALKFSGDDTSVRVKIGSRKEQGDIVFYLQDDGIGIDPDYKERVFGLFERLDPKIQGTGVGLSLVQFIIENHGGRIWVESEGLDCGSRFCFTLPDCDIGEPNRS